MDVVVLIGRILFALLFIASGIGHLTQTKGMAGYAASRGVPMAAPATIVSGIVILAGGLMVLLGIWIDLGALLIVVFLLFTAFLMHAFWREAEPGARQNEMIQFQKDTALAGAALMLFAFTAYLGDELGLIITDPLFSLG